MSLDLKRLRNLRSKVAVALPPGAVPMTDAAMAAGGAPMPPGMPPGAPMPPGMPPGAPPMDPAAMGGAPMPPGMPPGAPPMDPAAMGGAPMDPAAMGGMPPGGDPMAQPIMLTAGDLMQFVQMMQGQGAPAEAAPAEPSKRVTNGELLERITALEDMLQTLLEGLGVVAPGAMGGMPPTDPAAMGGMPPMDPAAMGGMPPMDPAAMGGMDPAMMGATKVASSVQNSLQRLGKLKKALKF